MGRKTAEARARALRSCGPIELFKLLEQQGRGCDVASALSSAFQDGSSTLHAGGVQLKLQVLALIDQHAVALCGEAPQDVVRALYEAARDRCAVAADGAAGAARLQLAALAALTSLFVRCETWQRDARLVKVHVETLFKIMERAVPHAAASPELCRTAAACLRRLEEAAPTLLLAGAHQLLQLARQEVSGAAEAYATLAASVLSHGAARCLDCQRPMAAAEPSPAEAEEQRATLRAAAEARQAAAQEAASQHALSALASADLGTLAVGGCGGGAPTAASPVPVPGSLAHISPVGTLDALATDFPSHRSISYHSHSHSEGDCCSPEEPGSPRGVASLAGVPSVAGTASTLLSHSQAASTDSRLYGAQEAVAPAGCHVLAASEASGSVQPDGASAQALLAAGGEGLRHFYVPSHVHWPDAMGHAALAVYLTPNAHEELRRATADFLAALPRLSVEGVAALTAALPPLIRLAALPQQQLTDALDDLLHSGRILTLQASWAALKLYSELPPGYSEWRARTRDAVLLMVNGPRPAEQRVVAITWALVRHHEQVHADAPSLFAGGAWRQLLPRADDPAQLLSLKVKALSACLAVGIGRAEEIIPLIFSWDGFWLEAPGDVQLRLATYALRMLGSAAQSYAALPAERAARLRRCASMSASVEGFKATRPAPTPHYVHACLVSSCLQLAATRPAYLPAVEAFLASVGGCSGGRRLHLALLNAADALFSAAAAAGSFECLKPRPRAGLPIARQWSGSSGVAAPRGSPADGSSDEDGSGDSGGSGSGGLSSVLRRMKLSVSKRFGTSPSLSPDGSGSLQQEAEACGAAPSRGASGALPTIPESSLAAIAPPQPPAPLDSWEEAEAWMWDSRTWAALSTNMLRHDPLAYSTLLLRLAQSGTGILPMGALRFLAAYASQYQGEAAGAGRGHALSPKEAGNAVLAICQAAACCHLLIGPQQAAAPAPAPSADGDGDDSSAVPARAPRSSRSGRSRRSDASSVRSGGAPLDSPYSTQGTATPQWTLQQEEIALGMQAVLSALTSHWPSDSVRRRAQSFLDLLANPSAWDLKLRVSSVARMLLSSISEAVSAAAYMHA